jgi:uncharacterized UBP type Zn finger protein
VLHELCDSSPLHNQNVRVVRVNARISFVNVIFFHRFRDMILAAPVTSTQPVLIKLQQTFAFLRYTLRAIYSPSELLKSARPPWFESGRQQDCSEFLRFLLDTIQEQEKMGRKGLTTFREHRVIEPPSTSKPAAASTVADETLPMEVKSSCSISAFESISETLDTSNDVDMLSQVFKYFKFRIFKKKSEKSHTAGSNS